MKSHFKHSKTAISCLVATTLSLSTAVGQDDGLDDDEIVELSPFTVDASDDSGYKATNSISGTRLNTRIKDVPMPIEVITEQFIEDTGATDLREALSYSAGIILSSQNDAGSNNSNTSVGGVHNPEGATSAKTETSYKVRGFITDATLRDGYRRQFHSDSANIGRVEVIRGPAALLYGIGNFGGIVNYLPKLPPAKEAQSFIVGFGNEGHRRVTHSIGRPLGGPWDLRFNLTSVYEENESYTELTNDDKFFFSPIFTFKPTEKTDVTIDFEFGDFHSDAIGFQSIRSRTGVSADSVDRLERSGFLDFPGKETRTMRWSGPDTFLDNETYNMRLQVTHRLAENLNLLVGYNDSKVEYHVRDVFGSIQTSVGPESLRDTVIVTPADALNGDGEFDAGPVDDAIFEGRWTEFTETVDREQVRVELNYNLNLLQNSELFGFKNSFLLGRSEEKSVKDVFKMETLENEHFYWKPTDPSYMRFGVNGDGTPAPGMEDVNNTIDTAWNQGTYLVHQGKFWNDRITTVSGIRRDRNDLNNFTDDFRLGTQTTRSAGAKEEDTTQFGLSFEVNDRLSVYALKADGIMPNFDGNRDVLGNPMDAVTAESEEVGIKFDLIEGKLSGTVSAYRIRQTGTPIFYWWAPAPAKNTFQRDQDIIYNVTDFNPTVEAEWRNGAFTAASGEWDAAVAAGSAYQIDGTWYVNASQSTGADYLDAVFDSSKEIGGWPGWLYNQDDNTNNATQDFAGDGAGGWNGYVSGDQESSGWEAQLNFAPMDNLQFVLNYAQTKREVVNAGAFVEYPFAEGNWDRWAVWYFPDGQWGLTGRSLEEQFTDPQDTSTWQGRGYGAGEKQDDTPLHAVSGWGNYKFTEGRMKGLSVGMGFQWEDKREYFSGITDGAGQLALDKNGNRVVLYTKDRLNVDAMARYDFTMGENPAHVQVNVYNLLDDTDPYGYIWARPLR
ncbi:MAG: TonB-dependent receptor plug domain-containing protein, partial [Verrucomicrobiota bacterium]